MHKYFVGVFVASVLTASLMAGEDKTAAQILAGFKPEEVEAWIKIQNALNAKKKPQSRDALDLAMQPRVSEVPFGTWKTPEVYTAKDLKLLKWSDLPPPAGFRFDGFKLRESWSDILAVEDPTVKGGKDKYKDLKGAKFSYSRNEKSKTDAWVAQAAVIAPFINYNNIPAGSAGFDTWGFTPSVTIDRLHDEADLDEKKEKDALTFRFGTFANYSFANPSPGAGHWQFTNLLLRGNFAYQTDTEFRKSIPAGELELEPKLWFSPRLGIGYRQILIDKADRYRAEDKPLEDNAWVAYQARIRLRGEYGQISRADAVTKLSEDKDFMHAGVVASLEIDPLFHPRLTAAVTYSYLPAIFGPSDHDTLVETELSFKLWDFEDGRKASISAKYVKGGLDFTQEQVETFYIGLSAVY
jgi:hypothetical protein